MLRRRLDLGRKTVVVIDELALRPQSWLQTFAGPLHRGSSAIEGRPKLILRGRSRSQSISSFAIGAFATIRRSRLCMSGADRRRRAARRVPIILMKLHPVPRICRRPRGLARQEFWHVRSRHRPYSITSPQIFSNPRDYVSAPTFNGPDRRRRQTAPQMQSRRSSDR